MRAPLWLTLLLACASCGGGSSGGSDPPGPAPPQKPFVTTINTGLAVAVPFTDIAAAGPWLLVPVSERGMNQDRNGDGDTSDDVLASVNTETDEITNLGYAVVGPILSSGSSFAFLVREASQGSTDLNGDGDTNDAVWLVYFPTQPVGPGNPIDTGVATGANGLPAIATEGGYVFLESEPAQGADLNADGDALDNCVAGFQEAVRSIVPLQSATHAPGTPLVARNGRVLVATSELASTTDLNRDGDAFDITLVVVDFKRPVPLLRPVGGPFPRAVGANAYQLTDTAAVYMINESAEGKSDLNNDGDVSDSIIAVFDIAAGLEHLPMSPQVPAFALAARPGFGIGVGADRAVVALDEGGLGIDLNGDLDTFDGVAGWIDTSAAPTVLRIEPLALAQQPILVAGTRALVAVSEKDSGAIVGVDQNGDGDIDDQVAFMIDMPQAGGGFFNLGVAATTLDLSDDDAIVGVPEAGQFGGDLNGNGSANDVVSMYFDFGDTPPTMRSLGIVAEATSLFRASTFEVRLAALIPEGQSGTYNDLNGDGDNTDRGLLLLGLDPTGAPPPFLPPTPFFAGTGALVVAPPLRVGDRVFVFASTEDMLRADLNGDADTLDTVLHFVRYEPLN